VFFQEMANHGHYGGQPDSTRQGIYVCAPSGKFLASINSNDPDRVLDMMRAGLRAWEQLPDAERWLPAQSAIQPRHRWEDSYPRGGLIANVISRDLPAQCDPAAPCEVKWNQDYVWFSKQEARQWLSADPKPGGVHQLPDELVARLARFHFVDNVKGQTPQFSRSGVQGSRIETKVEEVAGSSVKLTISGLTIGASGDGWWQSSNGVVTRVLGRATFDLDQGAFIQFEMVALGRRWGHTRYNARSRDAESGPLGYVFRLAAPNAHPIAPASIADYNADWVIRPARR
jgi:hypothetical protein